MTNDRQDTSSNIRGAFLVAAVRILIAACAVTFLPGCKSPVKEPELAE